MEEYVKAEIAKPNPKSTINSYRSFGYNLSTAIADIIDNSISANSNEIRLEYKWNGQDTFISISDNGIGIEKKYENLVFDKFFRIPKGDMHNVKGFGLGLAYVKKIVALHHGEIQVKSENNSTTFIISLPYA